MGVHQPKIKRTDKKVVAVKRSYISQKLETKSFWGAEGH
jgi:hypothetical protein